MQCYHNNAALFMSLRLETVSIDGQREAERSGNQASEHRRKVGYGFDAPAAIAGTKPSRKSKRLRNLTSGTRR
jgi:hypothetical protein